MTSDLADGAAQLAEMAARILRKVSAGGNSIATAESCTGGLVASLLTDMEGLSGSFDRGFVTYSIEAKVELLGIDRIEIERFGAVSRDIALAMAAAAIERSHASFAIAITGFAGPAGHGNEEGLVHIAVQRRSGRMIHRECHFGAAGRDRTRFLAAKASLEMLDTLLEEDPAAGH